MGKIALFAGFWFEMADLEKAVQISLSAVDMDTSCRYNIVRFCPGSWICRGGCLINQLPRILAKVERNPQAIRRSE